MRQRNILLLTLREKCPNTFFLVRIFRIPTEYGEISLRIQSKCGKIRIRKNSVFGGFSRSKRHVKSELNVYFMY